MENAQSVGQRLTIYIFEFQRLDREMNLRKAKSRLLATLVDYANY